jgi:NAD(P)-dependent dehydrogenase (short-subunit alcohol dehydrogenase family)
MKIQDSVALVTGANRGIGLAFARGLLAAGARKVYAAARDPKTIALPGVVPLALDVTDPGAVAAAAATAGDVTLLVNNAGIVRGGALLSGDAIAAARAELETNYFGPFVTSRAFAPILARNGGGAIINMLSALAWITFPRIPSYSASKAAAWSLTNALRGELRAQGTQVVGVHVGFVDTDMAKNAPGPKTAPDDLVARVLAAVDAGAEEVLVDEVSRQVKAGLSATPGIYLAGVGA